VSYTFWCSDLHVNCYVHFKLVLFRSTTVCSCRITIPSQTSVQVEVSEKDSRLKFLSLSLSLSYYAVGYFCSLYLDEGNFCFTLQWKLLAVLPTLQNVTKFIQNEALCYVWLKMVMKLVQASVCIHTSMFFISFIFQPLTVAASSW